MIENTRDVNFDDVTNFKEYFFKYDALHNVDYDVTFSVFRKYLCKANCEVCSIQKLWIPDDKFKKYVPIEIKNDLTSEILNLFDYFEVVNTVDDMFMIKHEYPHLYEFYKKYSHLVSLASITDNALPRHMKIIDELNFKSIHEISFSDVFIYSSEKTLGYVLTQLEKIIQKTPIVLIKLILSFTDINEPGNKMQRIIDWAKERYIPIYTHNDFRNGTNIRFKSDNAEVKNITNVFVADAPEFANMLLIFGETTYIQFNDFYMTSTTSMSELYSPYYTMTEKFSPELMLTNMLKEKKRLYARFATYAKNSKTQNKYHEYFTEISKNVQVNDDFNFIPIVMLSAISNFAKMLVERHDYEVTKFGWIKRGATNVIPIITYGK